MQRRAETEAVAARDGELERTVNKQQNESKSQFKTVITIVVLFIMLLLRFLKIATIAR
jgi:hypothetical protein